jgi:GntR family transcriptional regulator/MocR family aminotransferase
MNGVDLHLDVRGPQLLAGLTRALRDAVRTGRLAPGRRLPLSRTLAVDLGVARNTVGAAYAELIDEGWLTARRGAGTHVANRQLPPEQEGPRTTSADEDVAPLHDLRAGRPDISSFPRVEWAGATRRAAAQADHHTFSYPPPDGRRELRRALANYLARARGVIADPSRIVICSGASHGVMLLAAALQARQVDTVAVEAYGMPLHRDLLARAGLRSLPLPLDTRGARIDALLGAGPGAVLLTPAHQFPTGSALHPERRAAVVD